MKKIVTALFLFTFSTLSMADSSDVFQNYYSGNYSGSFNELKTLSEKNNKEAIYDLAKMYLYGFGVKKNHQTGIDLMTQSAKLKYLPAALYLGNYYFQEKRDLETALQWYKESANLDDVGAQMFAALSYLNGFGTKINQDIARKYMIMAAKKNIPMAEYELANLFFSSKYSTDKKMARIWLKKSAEENFPEAQYQLGIMMVSGNQYDKNEEEGITWLKKSSNNGNIRAKQFLSQMNTTNHNEMTNPETKEKTTLSKEQEWIDLNALLEKSGFSLKNPVIITGNNDTETKTPILVSVNKNSIIQPEFKVISPNQISIDTIISDVLRSNYREQKPNFYFQDYPFIFPYGTKNYQEAFAILKNRTTFGDFKSLFLLGQMYNQGLGVQKNDRLAFNFFEKSADFGYLKAEYMIGIFYLKGKVVEQNLPSAIHWLTKAALHGSQPAQIVLGNLYEFGFSNKGNPNYVEKNPVDSQAMYSLAAQTGSAIAQYRLAQLYASGILNPDNNQEIQKNNIATAYKLFYSAAQKKILPASIVLSYFYARPHEDQKNQKSAFSTIEKAADEGNDNAILLLAVMYDRGIGVRQSHRSAMRYYKKLSEKNNAIANFMLGTYYYLDGENEKAIALLEKSASKNNPYALYNLAILNQKNIYQKSEENYLSLLQKAAEQNFHKASILLADDYLSNGDHSENIKKSADIYEKLAKKQNATAELKLGYMYENGIFFPKNLAKANEWYLLSAKHNNPIAQYFVGTNYQLGRGVDRNIDEALSYYTQSAQKNYLPAEVALGFVYEVDKHDYKNAFQWYLKAAEKNNPEAQYNLSLMYEYGKGVEVNIKKAKKFYKEASKNGYHIPQEKIAAKD